MRGLSLVLMVLLLSGYSSAQDHHDSGPPNRRKPTAIQTTPKSVDQLWAEALWKSLPGSKVSRREIEQLLLDALAKADKKAPLYVALGDVDSGLVALRDSVQAIETSIDDTVSELKPLQSEAEIILDDELDNGEILARNFKESFNHVVLQELARTSIDDFAKQIKAGKSSSAVCYSQSVKVDPGYKLGWQKLAVFSEGAAAEKAVEGWIQHDPNNALPYYLRAARESEAGKLAAALQSIRVGNEKVECRSYSSAMPNEFELTYPADELFLKLGVAGTRISRSSFAFLVKQGEDIQPFGDPMCRQLGDVARTLSEEAERLQVSMKFAESIEYFESIRLMGVRLMCVEPHAQEIMYEGYRVTLPTDVLRELYGAQNNSDEIARLDRFQSARKLFRDRYFDTFLKDLKRDESNRKLWLRGQVDPQKEEQRLLEKAVRESGLLIENERHRGIDRQKKDR